MLSSGPSDQGLRERQQQSDSDLDFFVCDVFLLGLFQKTEISSMMHEIERVLAAPSFRFW